MPASDSAQVSTPQRTRFTLADAMILVAALALGLALLRSAWHNNFFSMNIMALAAGQKLPPGYVFLDRLTVSAWCVLPMLTLAVLIPTALRPKPVRRDAIGGPGFVACLIAMLAPVLPLERFLSKKMGPNGFGFGDLISNVVLYQHMVPFLSTDILVVVGSTIAAGWLALVLVGQWRPKPIWTDRLGCAIGACWVFLYGYYQIYFIVVLPLFQLWGIWSPE
jgi:hypothetical protein